MQYKIKKGSIEYVYDVEFDKDILKSLLDEIVRNCSYGVVGKYHFDYGSTNYKFNTDKTKIVSGESLINNDSVYVDIKKFLITILSILVIHFLLKEQRLFLQT